MDKVIEDKIEKIDWWHTIDLGVYGKTKGVQTSILWTLKLPEDLTGKTVLDLGTVDGCYAFEVEKRNAKQVLAVDSLAWKNEPYSSYKLKTGKDGFNLAKELLNSRVQDMELDDFNEEVTVEKLGQHDVVLCLGILYHMLDPFRFIRHLNDITKELLVIETHTDINNNYAWKLYGPPAMAFYPKDELNSDASNWWGPNVACIRDMLEVAGFKKTTVEFLSGSGRAVIHAFKEK